MSARIAFKMSKIGQDPMGPQAARLDFERNADAPGPGIRRQWLRSAVAILFGIFLLAFSNVRAAEVRLPASEAFGAWLQKNSGPSVTDPQAVATGMSLAQARSQEMRGLLERDPAEF